VQSDSDQSRPRSVPPRHSAPAPACGEAGRATFRLSKIASYGNADDYRFNVVHETHALFSQRHTGLARHHEPIQPTLQFALCLRQPCRPSGSPTISPDHLNRDGYHWATLRQKGPHPELPTLGPAITDPGLQGLRTESTASSSVRDGSAGTGFLRGRTPDQMQGVVCDRQKPPHGGSDDGLIEPHSGARIRWCKQPHSLVVSPDRHDPTHQVTCAPSPDWCCGFARTR